MGSHDDKSREKLVFKDFFGQKSWFNFYMDSGPCGMIDIGCQLGPHLAKIALEMREYALANLTGPALTAELAAIDKMEKIDFFVPWFHAAGHRIRCQLKWSALFASTMGRAIGETLEQIWGLLYPITGVVRYFTAERRRDFVSLAMASMDADHEAGLWEALCGKYITSAEKVVELQCNIKILVSVVKEKLALPTADAAILRLNEESVRLTSAQTTGRISSNWKVDFARLSVLTHVRGLHLPAPLLLLAFPPTDGSNQAEVARDLKKLTEEKVAELKALKWHAIPPTELFRNPDFMSVFADVVADKIAATQEEAETLLFQLAALEDGTAA